MPIKLGLFLRRLAALFYDSLLLTALYFLITAAAIGLNNGQAIEHWSYKLFLLLVAFAFFDWFWRHGGQTLGMRAWKLHLSGPDDAPITLKHTSSRFIYGCLLFGLTLLFIFFNPASEALHDRLSRTKITRYNK